MIRVDQFTYKKIKIFSFHILVGFLISYVEFLSKLYFFGILVYFTSAIYKSKDKTYYALAGAAYIAAAEIFLRMTKAMPFWEMGKYMVIYFVGLGILYKGFKLKAWPILIYILLLIPGIYIAYLNFDYFNDSFRKNILFNLSGPLALFATALFAYKQNLDFSKMMKLVDVMMYPIIAMTIYIVIYAPSLDQIEFTTESNQTASGGYSGNQVSTILGLGMFLTYVRFIKPYKSTLLNLANIAFLGLFSYRALLTFSRGGVITAVIMMIIFTFFFLKWSSVVAKAKAGIKLIGFGFGAILLWGAVVAVTGGLIANRYTGERADGTQKDITTGRAEILSDELQAFIESPFFGIGTGMGKYFRMEVSGYGGASHNEVSRMIAEHGMFGIIALLTLLLVPLGFFLGKKKNLFLIPFTAFWFLTINHSAMRVALPGFIYGLGLLQIQYTKRRKTSKQSEKKHTLFRQQTV